MKAYIVFGPSDENPHGHGGFLSPRNGACLSAGPLSPEVSSDVKSPGGGRADARKRARDGEVGSSKDSASEFDMRMVAAMEASVAVMSRSVEQRDLKGRAKEMDSIRNMLRECGECMTQEERFMYGRKLCKLYKQNIAEQNIENNGASKS